jgi:hypothetical protein
MYYCYYLGSTSRGVDRPAAGSSQLAAAASSGSAGAHHTLGAALTHRGSEAVVHRLAGVGVEAHEIDAAAADTYAGGVVVHRILAVAHKNDVAVVAHRIVAAAADTYAGGGGGCIRMMRRWPARQSDLI